VGKDKLIAVGEDGIAVEYKIPMVTQYMQPKLFIDESEPIVIEPEIMWETLQTTGEAGLRDICFVSASEGWIVGDFGTILHRKPSASVSEANTVDGGNRWENQDSPIDISFVGVHFISPEMGWIMAEDATILYTSNGGKTWHIQNEGSKPMMTIYDADMNPTNVDYELKSAQFPFSSEGWAVGKGAAILHNIDGGPVWTAQDSKHSTTFNDICIVEKHYGWAVGLLGVIMYTNDGGTTWLPQSSNTGYDLESVCFVNSNEGWVVGRNGIILHTNNSGLDWSSQDSGVSENLYAVHFVNRTEGWIVGQNGLVLHTKDRGITWEREGSGTDEDLYNIAYIKENGLIAVGRGCTIVKRMIEELYP
jgi:photosystem II stability/assembly factor-like uncharacterized protein